MKEIKELRTEVCNFIQKASMFNLTLNSILEEDDKIEILINLEYKYDIYIDEKPGLIITVLDLVNIVIPKIQEKYKDDIMHVRV